MSKAASTKKPSGSKAIESKTGAGAAIAGACRTVRAGDPAEADRAESTADVHASAGWADDAPDAQAEGERPYQDPSVSRRFDR